MTDTLEALKRALVHRTGFDVEPHTVPFRAFNGFTEGDKSLAIDVFGRSAVFYDFADASLERDRRDAVITTLRAQYPWLRAGVWKERKSRSEQARAGTVCFGTEKELDRFVVEDGVKYAFEPLKAHDAGFYVEMRGLRAWLKATFGGKHVLNTFAATGSLGVAARAGGADVVHTDKNGEALQTAKRSYDLNKFEVRRADFIANDFFPTAGRLKAENKLFDCVIVDPPFRSETKGGKVDLETEWQRVANKLRPLVAHQGSLVIVNNALFLPGAEFRAGLDALGHGGYVTFEKSIPIPDDVRGFGVTDGGWPADPAPFNHPTKIAVLKVTRKDGKPAAR